jgi:hypothetical protein
MLLCVPQHGSLVRGFSECLQRWATMQASTLTYVENAQHDLFSSRSLNPAHFGSLDLKVLPAMAAVYLESAEKMLRGLRTSVEAFDKIVDSLRQLASQAGAALSNSTDMYCATLLGWTKDVARMMAAEAAHKKMLLAILGSNADNESVERSTRAWVAEPMINRELISQIERAVL